jgi:hypothetical protein
MPHYSTSTFKRSNYLLLGFGSSFYLMKFSINTEATRSRKGSTLGMKHRSKFAKVYNTHLPTILKLKSNIKFSYTCYHVCLLAILAGIMILFWVQTGDRKCRLQFRKWDKNNQPTLTFIEKQSWSAKRGRRLVQLRFYKTSWQSTRPCTSKFLTTWNVSST